MELLEHEPPVFSVQSVEQKFYQLLSVAKVCVKLRAAVAGLILVYSSIDAIAWVASVHHSGKFRFTNWVNKYLLPSEKLTCTAIDLYGARCGIVHGLTSES